MPRKAKQKKAQRAQDKQQKAANTVRIDNRRARAEYEVIDTLVAGLALVGTEVKSLRLGQAQLSGGFVKIDRAGEAYLYGTTIPVYVHGNRHNHEPDRTRKLLLTRRELARWQARLEQERLTIVPLKVFFRGSWAKVEIALAKRKLAPDRRKDLRDRAIAIDIKRELKGR